MPREARRLRFPRGVCVGGMRWESGNVASGRVGGTLQTARRNAATGRWQKDGMLDEWLGSSPQVVRSFQQCSLPDRSRASNQNEGSDACACHDTNNQRKAERGLPGSLFMGVPRKPRRDQAGAGNNLGMRFFASRPGNQSGEPALAAVYWYPSCIPWARHDRPWRRIFHGTDWLTSWLRSIITRG